MIKLWYSLLPDTIGSTHKHKGIKLDQPDSHQLTAKCKSCEHKGRVSAEHTSFIIYPLSIHLRHLFWHNNSPPPDLISTQQGVFFNHCTPTGTSFVDDRWKISWASWRNNDSHSSEAKLWADSMKSLQVYISHFTNPWELVSKET